jgi:hypothetical protein
MAFEYALLIVYVVGFFSMMIMMIFYYVNIFKLTKLIKGHKEIYNKIYPKLPEYLFLWTWSIGLMKMFFVIISEPEIFDFSKEAKKYAIRANRAAVISLILFFALIGIATVQMLTIGTIHM